MKMFFLLGAVCLSAAHADSQIRFEGYVGAAHDIRFALFDADARQSKWVRIGDSFLGATVSEFDKAAKVLVVSRDDQRLRLPLEGATIIEPAKADADEGWRRKAEALAAKGDVEIRELLADYDWAHAEAFGYGIAVDFAHKHPASGVSHEEFEHRLSTMDAELKFKHEVTQEIKSDIKERISK